MMSVTSDLRDQAFENTLKVGLSWNSTRTLSVLNIISPTKVNAELGYRVFRLLSFQLFHQDLVALWDYNVVFVLEFVILLVGYLTSPYQL